MHGSWYRSKEVENKITNLIKGHITLRAKYNTEIAKLKRENRQLAMQIKEMEKGINDERRDIMNTNDIYEKNKIKAKFCLGCVYLHIGRNVDHNHCDAVKKGDDWHEDRTNGKFNNPKNIYYLEKCLLRNEGKK